MKAAVVNGREQSATIRRKRHLGYSPIFGLFLVSVIASFYIGDNRYPQRILLLCLLWAAATSSFNIISGLGGQVVFGYMMFIGTGAYAAVLLFKYLAISPWIGMLVGSLAASFLALAIGFPTLRLRGHYFAVATIAFPLILAPLFTHFGLEEVTIPFAGHGILSMQSTDNRFYVAVAALLLTFTLIITRVIETSRLGYALRAIKQNENAAAGMGIDVFKTKLVAFIISAALGGIMGTVYSFSCLFVLTTHAVFGVFVIVRILSINIVGGLGTLWGPVIASAILVPLGEFLNAQLGHRFPGVQDVVYGLALIVAIIYFPSGIYGKVDDYLRGRRSKKHDITEFKSSENIDVLIDNNPVGCPNTNGTILKLEGVEKSFGGVAAIKDISIEVPRGKLLGIIGPNGAGKTSLFNVINGYIKPDKGRIIFEGKDITHVKPHDRCKMGIARTFQVAQVFTKMTFLENVMIGAFAKTSNTEEAYLFALRTAKKMGIGDRLNNRAVGLSIWETKMLELSRALATSPSVLLVDEPMAGLNPEENERIGQILKLVADSGVTVIMIEHVVQSLAKIADIMVGLEEGEKVAEGTPDDVISDPHIIEAYLGTKWRERYAKGF